MNKRIFATLFLSIFAAITGVGIVVPLLPPYAESLGASGLYIGMIFGSFSLSRSVLLPYFGRKSDQRGRKPFIVVGLYIYALLSIAFMLSEGVNELIAIRFFQGMASAMILPVVQAYVGDITPQGKEGRVMGLFNVSMYGSLSLGPILGGTVKDSLGLDWAFGIMGITALCAALASHLLLPKVADEPRESRGVIPLTYMKLLRNPMVLGVSMFRLIYTLCIGVVWAFLPVSGTVKYGLSSSEIGVVIALGVFIAGVLQTPMGVVADRVSRRALVGLGGLLIAGAMFYFPFAEGFWGLALANSVFGVGGGVSIPALMAIAVIQGARTRSMGAVMSLLTLGHSLGMFLGSLIGGLVSDWLTLSWAYPVGGVIMLAGVAFFWFLAREDRG